MNEPKTIERAEDTGCCGAAPCSAAEEDAELVAFEWFATAHPHEAYATWPERFWLFFQTKCPGKTRAEMEKILAETAEPPNESSSATSGGRSATNATKP
jgi:hypothetical protein